MQRVHQLFLAPPHFRELLCQGFLPLGDNIRTGLFSSLLDILRTSGLRQILRHFPGNFPVFADDVRGAAQLMAFREPQKIKQKQILFARLRRQARAAPNHLAVQAAHFGGAQHYDAVYTGTIPALGQQHAVAQDIVFAV